VATENSVRSENTEVPSIREIMLGTRMSSLFDSLFALLGSSFRTRAALQTEILAPSSPTCDFSKVRAAPLVLSPLRPTFVGRVVPILVWMATMSSNGSARRSSPLAPQGFRLALDQGIAPPSRKARSCGQHLRSNSAHAPSQLLTMGCTPHSRRTSQVGDCCGAIHGGQIFTAAPQTTFPGSKELWSQSQPT
jgi:hypothetical protein